MSNHYSFRDMIEDEYNVQANPIINEKKTLRENFEQLLNQMTIRENIKSVLNYLSKKLNFLKYEESKDIFINYFKKISDLIKEFSRHNLIFNQKDKIVYLTLINAISKFFKYYIKQKIIIDDNNKQILNEFSNFFKFFFELCQSEQNIDIDILNYEIELFIIIINFFSDLALKFESMIPIFLNNHLCFLMKNYYGNKNEYKRLLKVIIMLILELLFMLFYD